MAKTFTEVDTRKAPTNGESNVQYRDEQRRQRDEQSQRNQGKLALIITPIALAAATGAAVMAFRRVQGDDRKKSRRR